MTAIQIVYLAGAPAALVFPILYTATARWWRDKEGRLFFFMAVPAFLLYAASALFILFDNGAFRDFLRLTFASVATAVSWATLIGYLLIRRDGIRKTKRSRDLADERSDP